MRAVAPYDPDLVDGSEADAVLATLTPREREVAEMVARGHSNRQIANRLVISEGTANNHVKRMLSKLGLERRSQLAALVVGLSTPLAAVGSSPGAKSVPTRPRSAGPGHSWAIVALGAVATAATLLMTLHPWRTDRALIASGASPRLLRADDFSDPANGGFLDDQRGTIQWTFCNEERGLVGWDYAYRDGALIAHVKGPYIPNSAQVHLGPDIPAAAGLEGDFAAEVDVAVTKSLAAAVYGLRLGYDGGSGVLKLAPGGRYLLRDSAPGTDKPQCLALPTAVRSGKATDLRPGPEPNRLRMEIRGDLMRGSVNGREVDAVRYAPYAARPARVVLLAQMAAEPADGEVELRFRDFKLYSLS